MLSVVMLCILFESRMFKYFLIIFFCQLWVQIVDGDIEDSTRSDLYEYVVDFLTFCSDQDLVWKYSEWVLQKNEEVCDWCTCFLHISKIIFTSLLKNKQKFI